MNHEHLNHKAIFMKKVKQKRPPTKMVESLETLIINVLRTEVHDERL